MNHNFPNGRSMSGDNINAPNDPNFYNYGNFPPYMQQGQQAMGPQVAGNGQAIPHHYQQHHQQHHPHHQRRLSLHSGSMPNMVAPFSNSLKNEPMFDNHGPDGDGIGVTTSSMVAPININRHRPPRFNNWDDPNLYGIREPSLNNSPHNIISPISEDFNYDSNESDPSLSASFGANSHPHAHPLSNPRMVNRHHANSFSNDNIDQYINFASNPPNQGHYSMSLPNQASQNSGWYNHGVNPDGPHSTSRSARGSVGLDPDHLAKHDIIMMEKRRRRRESHNAVERRRRDNINEKIQELSTLLPSSLIDNSKSNKGQILRKSVDYIRQLQTLISQKQAEGEFTDLDLLPKVQGLGSIDEDGYTQNQSHSQ
ncbi:HLH-domain-containing protein [Neoconidiobolus thromboides FSU 785]|nr:HLH-domain-containing protein [Neoconidiobolus thromboides FSU 785]